MAQRVAAHGFHELSGGGRVSLAGAALMQEEAGCGLDWDALYADQAPRVYNYFRFRLGGSADVEDLTSRTFEKAWRSRARYQRDVAGFSTWLFKIAHNVALDHLLVLRNHLPIDAAADVAAERTPEREAERDSDLARLALLTASLPDRERELIALKFGAELNNRLIARLTGISESNVGTIVHRTVRSLRARWHAVAVAPKAAPRL